MKTQDEIQRAHDLLVGIILGEVPSIFKELSQSAKIAMVANADVLCWLLGHAHNQTFAHNMEMLEAQARERGPALIKPSDN